MTNSEFVSKLKYIATLPTTYYSVSGGEWAKWNGKSWNFDCVILIKAILWGWKEDKLSSHGGAIYRSNNVYDDNANGIIKRCENVSNDFSTIQIGELLWMDGHVGIYVGNRKVIECTAAWENKVVYSIIGANGERSRNGKQVYSWKKHGKLPYIIYENTTKEEPINVYYRVKTKKYGWLEEVKNLDDYAGYKNDPITDIAIRVDKGYVKYRVSPKNKNFLPYVTEYDIKDFKNGYAGNGSPIDRLEVYFYLEDKNTHKIKYKVNDFSWQYNNEKTNNQDGYAGLRGKNITKIQMIIT